MTQTLNLLKNSQELQKGYAFAFQALGLLYYDFRARLSLEEIIMKFDDLLDDFVYRKIWQGLSEQDRKVILAISDSKTKVTDIYQKLNMTSSTFSKYRERLINRALIQSSQHGYVELILPRFAEVASFYAED